MKTVNLVQGSPEWHAHRAAHWNASDAPAMMGASPYKTRAQLLRELATGIVPEVDAATQARFDAGHRFEALARPLAEKIVGEDLYACVGVDGKWSASFDGLTLTGEVAWEHKSVNAELRELIQRAEGGEPIHADHLPEHYQIQMDHQALVSGAHSVLFMATRWEGDDELAEQFWCWYSPNADRQMRIAAGWQQFERDLASWQPEPAEAPKPIAAPVEGFGVLALRVEGRVLASNLDAFRAGADAFIARLPKPTELQTDQDFADADAAVKACAEAEDRIKAAKALALAQMSDVDAVLRTADTIAETIRAARLALDKAVFTEKDRRKSALVRAGVDAVRAHYDEINATLGEHAIATPATLSNDIGSVIKGLKTLASMRDKIDAAVAAAKIDASQRARRVFECLGVLSAFGEHAHLFPDRVWLCANKAPDDLANLVTARIADHQRREDQRIREAEERGRQMAEIAAQREAEAKTKPTEPVSSNGNPTPESFAQRVPKPAGSGSRIKLGEIQAAISPLSINAKGLAQLGFPHIATDKAAKLYDEASFEPILSALAKVIARADLRREAA